LDATGYAKPALDVLANLDLPIAMKQEAEKLRNVVSDIQKALDDLGITDVSLTFDAFETKGFEYHSGIAFTLFAKSIRGELGRGGHYYITFGSGQSGQHKKNAIGFTLYMDTIRPAVKIANAQRTLAVSVDIPWLELEELRKEGWGLVRVQNEQNLPEQVTHIYKNGKPEER
jgi:ATP phosphoribosyltransferase regulatory subunit